MTTYASLIDRVRKEIADKGEPFQHQIRSDGVQILHDLPVDMIRETGFVVKSIDHLDFDVTVIDPTDYTVDEENGYLTLDPPLTAGDILMCEGTHTSLFTDAELAAYVNDALLQHTSGRTVSVRYRDGNGFILYDEQPITVTNLPEEEEFLVAILATIETLWALSTDAATDVDIQTAEGTSINRSQRYRQILQQIDLLTEKYRTLCEQLNVGLFRIEMNTLRRISRTNNRLVPVYKAREYDQNGQPQRLLPPVDHRNDDDSGIPSPAVGGWW